MSRRGFGNPEVYNAMKTLRRQIRYNYSEQLKTEERLFNALLKNEAGKEKNDRRNLQNAQLDDISREELLKVLVRYMNTYMRKMPRDKFTVKFNVAGVDCQINVKDPLLITFAREKYKVVMSEEGVLEEEIEKAKYLYAKWRNGENWINGTVQTSVRVQTESGISETITITPDSDLDHIEAINREKDNNAQPVVEALHGSGYTKISNREVCRSVKTGETVKGFPRYNDAIYP